MVSPDPMQTTKQKNQDDLFKALQLLWAKGKAEPINPSPGVRPWDDGEGKEHGRRPHPRWDRRFWRVKSVIPRSVCKTMILKVRNRKTGLWRAGI
jgi:hypothetical protein